MPVKTIESLSQFKEIIASDNTSVIDFYAPWCGPCVMMSPHYEKSSEAGENSSLDFYKVNIDDVPDVAQEVGVRSIPLFQVWRKGGKVDEVLGANQSALKALIQKGASEV